LQISVSGSKMAKKGKEKNTKNKAKHRRLIAQKKNKEKLQKEETKQRLKILNQKINAQK